MSIFILFFFFLQQPFSEEAGLKLSLEKASDVESEVCLQGNEWTKVADGFSAWAPLMSGAGWVFMVGAVL